MTKTMYVLAAGSLVIAAISFYQLAKFRRNKKKSQSIDQQTLNNSVYLEDRILYLNQVVDEEQFSLHAQKPAFNKSLGTIKYEIILNLNKGTKYDGMVKINVNCPKVEDLIVDFRGKSVLFLAVNERKILQEEVIFKKQQIHIQREWLEKGQNVIEIIFSNKYAFMGDGLTASFFLDENNKYSLKGQTIYTKNGAYKAPKLFPCMNLLNPCQIKLQLLHPEGFDAFGNNPKSLVRLCSKEDYPQYEFFFQPQLRKLNRSFKMNASFSSSKFQNNSIRSNDEIVKSNTQFYDSNLSSIHGFFLLCSSIYEVRPTVHKVYSSDILIRYFVKEHCIKKAQNYISLLHYQIMEISSRLEKHFGKSETQMKISHKIDVFFVNEDTAEGCFYTGAIYMAESTLDKSFVDMRIYYLLCRAILGMGLLEKRQHDMLRLQGKIKLNELTLQVFPECVDLLYVKQQEYLNIKKKINAEQKSFMNENEHWIQEYYEKECRFLVHEIDETKISKNVFEIMDYFNSVGKEEFWAHFIVSFQFIQPTVSEVMIKIGIRHKGVPIDEATLNYAKQNFVKSKYYIKFFTDIEVQNDLKRFIELDSYGLEKRIPFIKIKQKFKKLLTEKIENYLAIKSNRLEAKSLYEQFKKYNESRNFHHISILRKQIKRVKLLCKDLIKEERRNLQCGLIGWKLLRKLSVFPKDDFAFRLLEELQSMDHE